MNRHLTGYDGVKAQLQRDAMRTPEFTLRDVVDVFRAFARDFENFDPDKVEPPHNTNDSENVGSLCSDESDSSSEGSVSSLDEMAVLYAELEDMESDFEESTLPESAPQINRAALAIDKEDPVIGETASPVDLPMDETASLSEELASYEASASCSEIPLSDSVESSRSVDYPLSFIVYKGRDGSIIRIETEHFHSPYQYHISVGVKQIIDPKSLRFFMEILEQEQVCATALSKFINTLAVIKYGDETPQWLPTLLRHGVHETVHEYTLRCLLNCLRKSAFKELDMRDKLIFDIREMLEDFYLVANSMNAPELRLFTHMNNIVVLPDVLGMTSAANIMLYFFVKERKLCRFLKEAKLQAFMVTAKERLSLSGPLPVVRNTNGDVIDDE